MIRRMALWTAVAVVATACGSGGSAQSPATTAPATNPAPSTPTTEASTTSDPAAASSSVPVPESTPRSPSGLLTSEGWAIPAAPAVPTGPPTPELVADLERVFVALEDNLLDNDAILDSAEHADPRVAWIYTDILRFVRSFEQSQVPVTAFQTATGRQLPAEALGLNWKAAVDFLIAWDTPAIPGYDDYKRRLYATIEPGWAPFFEDPGATIDWRFVSWGGVFIDDRPLGVRDGCPRGCIPALDDPVVTDAAGGSWYDDDAIIFGVTVNGESRAYPKHQMETHEMINDTLGGRRLGIPYCTLCGSAQAYFTDSVPADIATPVLRTSGLLSRSNKVMYDFVTKSVFDTFTGEAVTGPLRESGVRLEQATVVASTWGAWKEVHPETTIVAQDGGIGFVYRLDPLGGRDDDGPIFPIGNVDPRLSAQEIVVGVELDDGRALAFPKRAAVEALESGEVVGVEGVRVELVGTGLVVRRIDGSELATHEAFWFAWSQFWPSTELWTP